MNGVEIFETGAKAVEAAAKRWAEIAHESVRERGVFRVAMSGGGTAKALWFILSKPEYADLPWKKTQFYWGDDRYVAISHGESNFRAARDLLLNPVAALAENIHPMPTGGTDPIGDGKKYEDLLRREFADSMHDGFPQFDLAFQGMGPDGHTASLFPEKPALAETERWVVASRAPNDSAVRDRLTMTVPVFNHARNILFLVTGEDKADRVVDWLEGDLAPEKIPAKLLVPIAGTRHVILDREAAGKLKNV